MFFRQLGINDGLNASSFWHAALDENGFIWVASLDGLFMYDGYSVQHFTQETHPQLPSNVIGSLQCDSKNRIWIQTSNGIAMADENRRLHHIVIPGYNTTESIDRMVFEAPGVGIIAITPFGAFVSKDGINGWQPYAWLNTVLKNNGVVDVSRFDDHSLLLCLRGKRVLLLNFKEQKIIFDFPLPRVMGICRLNDNEILAGTDERWGLNRINIKQKKIIKQYGAPQNKKGKTIQSGVAMMRKASDGRIYITTRRNGLVRFNPENESLENFGHDITDDHSISTNALRMVVTNDAGLVVVTSPNGVNFTNVNYSMLKTLQFFKDAKGNMLQESVNGLTSDKQGNIFISASNHVLRWNRKTGISHILRDLTTEEVIATIPSIPSPPEIDAQGNLWVGFNGDGIMIYDNKDKLIRHLSKELPTKGIRLIHMAGNGQMLVGSEEGLFMINPKNFAIDTFKDRPPLQKLLRKRIIDIHTKGDDVWFAVSPNGGVYHYNFFSGALKIYDVQKGLSSSRAYCLAADKLGNIYAGTRNGLSIIDSNGKITNIDKTNGLKNARIESMETDDSGFVWFTNNSNLCRYDPWQKKLTYFDEHNGITSSGFGIESSHKSPDGELFFGTGKGLIHFNPGEIKQYDAPLKLFVEKTTDGKNYFRCDKDSVLEFAYKEGKVIFQVAASDIINNQRLYYRFKLVGLDTGWSEPTHNRSITYNLGPGNYRFQVQTSYDRVNYIAAAETISVKVNKPFWQTWLFRIASIFVFIIGFVWFYKSRILRLKKKLQIQKQLAELEAKALRAQMNPHFIFNSLNAIQECIVTEKTDEAFEYLSKFSRLLRLVLNNSEKNFISLSSELEMIRLYLSLESLRFRQSFTYFIEVDETIDADETQVPTLLIQPYIENAVWHGLRMKEGEKKLWIRFSANDQHLIIEIEDNGIGREKAAVVKKQKLGIEQFESKGMALSQQRIGLLNRQGIIRARVETIDMVNSAQQSTGTKIIIQLPFDTQKLSQSKPFEHAKNTDR